MSAKREKTTWQSVREETNKGKTTNGGGKRSNLHRWQGSTGERRLRSRHIRASSGRENEGQIKSGRKRRKKHAQFSAKRVGGSPEGVGEHDHREATGKGEFEKNFASS